MGDHQALSVVVSAGHEDDSAGDNATESYAYDDESGDDNSQYSYSDDDGRTLSMPPLKYARILGSLPRANTPNSALSVKITSSAMGRVTLRPSPYADKTHESSMLSASRHGEGESAGIREGASKWNDYEDEEADMCSTKIYHVLALGFEDGKVRLVDALTGGSVLFGSSVGDGGAWFVNPTAAKRGFDSGCKIVALSFDSKSCYLSALNAVGDSAIFGPLIWGKQSRLTQSSASGGEGQQKNGFLSSLGGRESDLTKPSEKSCMLRPPFTLIKPPASTVRFTYADPRSFGSSLLGVGSGSQCQGYHPTCMALDPSYGRKKDRALIVGFDDGRLIVSKLQGAAGIGSGITSLFGGGGNSNTAGGGGTTAKKIDTELFQGMGGIEAVTWRGRLVAWAESSGIRLFDIESMSRIAHIPRPNGARSSLYPTISSMRPSISFEQSDSLLVGWGDCLMAIRVQDVQSLTTRKTEDGLPKEKNKRTPIVTMCWDLDCVVCSVVPVDEKYVAVLGLIPSSFDTYETEEKTKSNARSVAGGDNILEIQLINRLDGNTLSVDRLPLVEGSCQIQSNQQIATANAADFCLLSSFSCSRMGDVEEWDALNEGEREAISREAHGVGLESSSGKKVSDFHLRWDISRDSCSLGKKISSEAANYDDQSVSSSCSVCSDNYVFALSEPIEDLLPNSPVDIIPTPPIMAVLYSFDAVLVQTRDIDDVISYARSLGKPALALKQALVQRRRVRRHGLDQLVDEFFLSLLRMGPSGEGRPLSFSRLKIAAESLPILLGGDSRMWQRWIFLFGKIPGGLFMIREKIPVRDPYIPTIFFEMSLERMLNETVASCNENEDKHDGKCTLLGEKMADLFLETMRSWGPTSGLRRHIQMHRYCAHSSCIDVPFIEKAEKDLHRRISQTAFGVLVDAAHPSRSIRQHIDPSKDSLFDVEQLIARFVPRITPSSVFAQGKVNFNCFVTLEAMAELELMRERFDRALGYYLAIGSHFMIDRLPLLEEEAVQYVNTYFDNSLSPSTAQSERGSDKYKHVLSLIELHQLSHILMKRNFVLANEMENSAGQPPIVALIMLVGLEQTGKFIKDNCSPPEVSSEIANTDLSTLCEKGMSLGGLPIDRVARQMKSRPKLLFWFLFQLFIHKPDIYIKFPTAAMPPAAIIDLHRIQFSLFVDFADGHGDMCEKDRYHLAGNRDTPFIAFLRAALPYGGVQADSVRKKLENHRSGVADSPIFARELAFVIENFGEGSMEDAREILQLYLCGVNNLYMAVAFAERNIHSNILWDMLVKHCTTPDPSNNANQNSVLGALFGSLLEAAAHTGADLASLVCRIPEGMSIEGLRPKLISAITDYRHKVKIHEQVNNMLMDDKVSVLRELIYLSRRGERIDCGDGESHTNLTPVGLSSVSRVDKSRSWGLKVSSSRRSYEFSLPIR